MDKSTSLRGELVWFGLHNVILPSNPTHLGLYFLTYFIFTKNLILYYIYFFRIGRTGRKDQTGTAYTLFTSANSAKAKDLCSVLSEAKQVVNPKLQELAQCSGFNKRAGGGGGRGNYHYIYIYTQTLI